MFLDGTQSEAGFGGKSAAGNGSRQQEQSRSGHRQPARIVRRLDRAMAGLALSLAALISLGPHRATAQGAVAVGLAVGQSPSPVPIAPAYGRGITALGELVAGLGTTTRVLLIAAHPDDEDNRLLAWLARKRHVESA